MSSFCVASPRTPTAKFPVLPPRCLSSQGQGPRAAQFKPACITAPGTAHCPEKAEQEV